MHTYFWGVQCSHLILPHNTNDPITVGPSSWMLSFLWGGNLNILLQLLKNVQIEAALVHNNDPESGLSLTDLSLMTKCSFCHCPYSYEHSASYNTRNEPQGGSPIPFLSSTVLTVAYNLLAVLFILGMCTLRCKKRSLWCHLDWSLSVSLKN